ncbi:hypothetical protein GW17_00022245 [Ensete ventricosum]|nr:hypothetical protein GW17_00022245 [Ensete ventricosum]
MMSEWWVKKGPGGNLPGVTNENLRPGINVSHEERENDVGGEEGVDDVVGEEQPTLGRSVHERDLEGIHPCRVRHQRHHERFPAPARQTHLAAFLPWHAERRKNKFGEVAEAKRLGAALIAVLPAAVRHGVVSLHGQGASRRNPNRKEKATRRRDGTIGRWRRDGQRPVAEARTPTKEGVNLDGITGRNRCCRHQERPVTTVFRPPVAFACIASVDLYYARVAALYDEIGCKIRCTAPAQGE